MGALKVGLAAFPDASALAQLAIEIKRERTRIEKKEAKEREAEANKAKAEDGPSSVRALLDQARTAYGSGRHEEAISPLTAAREAATAATTAAGGASGLSVT